MSRAYCLTCNEQVHETPSGTCPLGHPVTAADHGPEPWVGFAEVEARSVATDLEQPVDGVPLERLDTAGRPVAHAGVAASGTNGHAVNGHAVNGHTNGHGPTRPGTLLDGAADLPPREDPAAHDGGDDGHAADDLAALLAEALEQEGAGGTPAPDEAAEPDTASLWDGDWDELSGLAAELQLDAEQAVDAAPEAPAPAPEPDVATPDLDALLADLAGGTAEPAPPEPLAPQPPAPLDPAPPTAAAPPPPPPPPAAPVTPPPPPVVDPVTDPDTVAPVEDVPSPAPEDVSAGLWDDPQDPVDEPAPAPEVDLTNFTARGSRVGGGSAGSPRRWFRKKSR